MSSDKAGNPEKSVFILEKFNEEFLALMSFSISCVIRMVLRIHIFFTYGIIEVAASVNRDVTIKHCS